MYFGLLFGFSLASEEVTLPPGDEKYFCEIDCHLAYSVRSANAKLQGGGRRLHLIVRTRFDETTISARRPREAHPSPREIVLLDNRQRQFLPESMTGTPLNHPLIPGESYETGLIFRIPADAKDLRLLITTPGWDYRFLIGDENSLGHEKTYLAIPSAGTPASADSMPEFSSSFLHD